jgi:ATP-binding cassette subfamily G (WHITE) protein 2 (SNQ2)
LPLTFSPYAQIVSFWRYWIYYINPWTYILGAEVFFGMRNIPVTCKEAEFATFPAPAGGQTCEGTSFLLPFSLPSTLAR